MIRIRQATAAAVDTAYAWLWWAWIALRCGASALRNRPTGEPRSGLFLAWHLPPKVTGGVYRPTSFLKYGVKMGWRLAAISGPVEEPADEAGKDLLDSIPKSVAIHRLRPPRLRPSWRLFPRIDGGFLNALATVELGLRKFGRKPPAYVVASGPPFHNFVAAYYLARAFGAKLVLDYRDEWTQGTRDFIDLGNRDEYWEARCLVAADTVFFASEGFLSLNQNAFPSVDAAKFFVLHNGWDADEFGKGHDEEASSDLQPPNKKLMVSFIGRSGSFLSIKPFLKLLNAVFEGNDSLSGSVELRFVGRQPPEELAALEAFARGNPGSLHILPEVPKSQAIRIMRESDALLLVNNPRNHRVIPGKLFEYVAAGPPILLYGAGGEMGELVSGLGVGPIVGEGESEALELALQELENGVWPRGSDSDREVWLREHTRETLATRFYETIARR